MERARPDCHRVYVFDFGLAASRRFEVPTTEGRFLDHTADHDLAYVATQLVNTVVTTLAVPGGSAARNAFVRRCAHKGATPSCPASGGNRPPLRTVGIGHRTCQAGAAPSRRGCRRRGQRLPQGRTRPGHPGQPAFWYTRSEATPDPSSAALDDAASGSVTGQPNDRVIGVPGHRGVHVPLSVGTEAIGDAMDTVGIRELADRASAVVGDVERTGQPVIVTNRGRPVAVVSAIDEDALYDYVLAHAPEYVRDMREAEASYTQGTSDSRPLHEVLAELDNEENRTASA